MITPRFKLSQTETTIIIVVRAPYCNLRESEVSIEDETFIFCSSPYHLRLHLPGRLLEDNLQTSFNSDSGEFTFNITKAIEGEHFPDLNLITKLLTPKIEVSDPEDITRSIVVLTNEGPLMKSDDELNEEFGFGLCGKKNFQHVSAEFKDVFEVDPREIKLDERHKMRLQYEQGKFDMCHYLSDFIENEEILEKIALPSPWNLQKDQIEFSESELDFLKDLTNKQFSLSETQLNYVHCCLIDILFAYCYDRRTTEFEGSSESGWNIVKLAATFCWLDVFKTPKEALVSAFRRSVIYPLYRHFDLSQAVFGDVKQIVKLGQVQIIKCLIEMYQIFLKGDCCRYILNNLFIKDYIIFIMNWDQEKWELVAAQVENTTIEKSELGLNLQEFETDACEELTKFTNLKIRDSDSDDSDDSSSDDDSSCSDEFCERIQNISIQKV